MLNLKIGKNFSSEECYTLIKVIRNSCKIESWLTNDENFNHNTGFKGMLSIVKNEILSIDDMVVLDKKKLLSFGKMVK